MDIKLKQRVVGILVLIAILAIFVPLLFYTSRPVNRTQMSRAIPQAPSEPDVSMDMPSSLNSSSSASTETLAEPNQAANQTTRQITQTQITPINTQVSTQSAPQKPLTDVQYNQKSQQAASGAKQATQLKQEQAQSMPHQDANELSWEAKADSTLEVDATTTVQQSANLKTDEKTAMLHHAGHIPQAWSILVGTFSNSKHAADLVKTLRGQGYDIYTRHRQTNGKQLTMIFVGPDISQGRMEQVQQQLQSRFGLKGVVKKYMA